MKLLETIRFENGEFANMRFHQQRMDVCLRELFGADNKINLEKEVRRSSGFPLLQTSTLEVSQGVFKCRIIYSKQIEKIEFIPYQLPDIQSLKMVIDDNIDYSYKYYNRNHLKILFSQKGDCDDILIVKNGFLTDTSFANILFYNGKEWLTPANPLLKGTQRKFLLETEKINTAEIRPSDLKCFKRARLVNAMMRFEDEMDVNLSHIFGD